MLYTANCMQWYTKLYYSNTIYCYIIFIGYALDILHSCTRQWLSHKWYKHRLWPNMHVLLWSSVISNSYHTGQWRPATVVSNPSLQLHTAIIHVWLYIYSIGMARSCIIVQMEVGTVNMWLIAVRNKQMGLETLKWPLSMDTAPH